MLIKEICDKELEMMNTYRRANAYSRNTDRQNEKPMSYVLRYWNSEKETLFKLLGNKLMYEEEVSFETPKDKMITDMGQLAWNHSFAELVREYIDNNSFEYSARYRFRNLFDSEYLVDNKYKGDSIKAVFNGKTIQLQHGAKPLRILAKIAVALGEEKLFEDFRLKHSQILNVKKTSGKLVLSIHPLDYMTMSDNNSGWTSCMSWREKGCYRRGTVEMMNSPCAIVAYVKADKDMYLGGSCFWNNKKWRNLCLVTPEFITSVKAYPYASDYLTSKAVEILVKLAKENLNWDFEDKIVPYDADDIFIVEEDGMEKRYYFNFETDAMYNDFESVSESQIAIAKGLTPNTYWLNYSGEANCMCCGDLHDFYYDEDSDNESVLTCDYCEPTIECEHCGLRMLERDDLIEVDGIFICEDCYDNETATAADDEETHLIDNMYQVYLAPREALDPDVSYNWNYIWLTRVDNKTIEEFTTGKLHRLYRGWRSIDYITMSEMTKKAAEYFDIYSKRDFINYYQTYSLTVDQSWEKRRAEREGREWLVDKPDDWDEILFNANQLAEDFFFQEDDE